METLMLPLVLSSDSHVFEPPDLWQTRIDKPFRDRAPRIEPIDGGDCIVVEADQILSGIGLISNAGARFEAPETISAQGRFEDVLRGGYDPEQHLKDMALDGVSGEVLYPSQGLFYFKVADPALMSAIFRAYNDWLAEFCRTDPARLKGIAMINLDDVEDGIGELERIARLGLSGAMITEYPLEDRRYDQAEYEPFWTAAAALGLPLSLHTATRRQGRIRGAGDRTLRDASSRATKAFYPALSLCDMIFAGVFERHPRLRVAIVEFELAWAPHLLSTMDYTYRERHGEAIYRFKDGMLPSDFFHRNVVLSFQEDAIGIRLRDLIGVDNMMWGSDYPHSESTFPRSRKVLAEILEGVPQDEQAKIAGGNTARVYNFDVASLTAP
jgi:predicted TIM-barrel fold metal-dependent hydrolase